MIAVQNIFWLFLDLSLLRFLFLDLHSSGLSKVDRLVCVFAEALDC